MTGVFEFATAARVIVGAHAADQVPDLVAAHGTRVAVCTGAHPTRHADLLARLPAHMVITTAGEPTVDDARAAVARAREAGADLVLAVGGGSVLDLGKAVGILLGNGGDPLDYLEVVGAGRPLTAPPTAVIAVPTTAGTGSEVTANAVLASPEHGVKASLRSRAMLPTVAVVDPTLTLGCPPAVTAASGLDALTQCLEPFVSRMATPITDALAREGLRRGASGLRMAFRDGSDLTARTDMSVCSLLGGMALANAKLGAVHGLAGVIGGMVRAAHGAICAALLAPVIKTTVAALPPGSAVTERYREIATLLTGDPGATVDDGIAWIVATTRELQVPGLAGLGVPDDRTDEIAAKAAASSSMKGHPVGLTDEQLRAVLVAAR